MLYHFALPRGGPATGRVAKGHYHDYHDYHDFFGRASPNFFTAQLSAIRAFETGQQQHDFTLLVSSRISNERMAIELSFVFRYIKKIVIVMIVD